MTETSHFEVFHNRVRTARQRIEDAGKAFARQKEAERLERERAERERNAWKYNYEEKLEEWLSTAPPEPVGMTLEKIIRRECQVSNLTTAQIKSERKTSDLVIVRHKIMWLASKLTTLSLPKIGKMLGDRDHTTILHGIRKYELLIGRGDVPNPLDEEFYRTESPSYAPSSCQPCA